MKEFFWKHFVKDYENYKDPEVRAGYTRLTGTMGILVNTVLCIAKIILGLAIHSIAVIADGAHDMADSLVALITLIGARISRKPADKDHPYGHARAEYIASLTVSVIILIVGYELLKNSVLKCLHPVETTFSWLMVGFMIFAILLKGASALFTIATGKHIDSLSVIAAGTDNRNDVIASIIIVCGMLVHHFTGVELDGYLGCMFSLFIVYSGIMIIRQTVNQLLGARPDPEVVSEMEEIIKSHSVILDVHDMVIYSYGPGKTFGSFHAEVDADRDIMEIHDAIDHIEREVLERLNINVTCHMDPVYVNDPVRNQLDDDIRTVLEDYDAVEGFHDLRILHDKGKAKVSLDVVLTPGKAYSAEEITDRIKEVIKKTDETLELDISFDQAYTITK
ncbi:MAG: cation transporter [Firmicutes bacterium]|nr:cation transporter [Bacillota bacterium]